MNITSLRNRLANGCYRILMKWTPVDTGELAISVTINYTDDGFYIEIPKWYTVYTNEAWINRAGVNPNEGWIDNAVSEMYEYIRAILSGSRWGFSRNEDEYVYDFDRNIGV